MLQLSKNETACFNELIQLLATANANSKATDNKPSAHTLKEISTNKVKESSQIADFFDAQSYEMLKKLTTFMLYGREFFDGKPTISMERALELQEESFPKSQEGLSSYLAGKSPEALAEYFKNARGFLEFS